jgi:hypothetical protein
MKYSQRITVHCKIICHSVEYLTEINEQIKLIVSLTGDDVSNKLN